MAIMTTTTTIRKHLSDFWALNLNHLYSQGGPTLQRWVGCSRHRCFPAKALWEGEGRGSGQPAPGVDNDGEYFSNPPINLGMGQISPSSWQSQSFGSFRHITPSLTLIMMTMTMTTSTTMTKTAMIMRTTGARGSAWACDQVWRGGGGGGQGGEVNSLSEVS